MRRRGKMMVFLMLFVLALNAGSISGTVTGSGESLSGLNVYLYGVYENYMNSYELQTDDAGAFSFTGVEAGSYILFLQHVPGYHHYFYENGHSFAQAEVLELSEDEELTGLELILEPVADYSLSGTVYELDEGINLPLSNALVSGFAINCWGEGEYFNEITDEYGHYSTVTSGGLYWLFSHKANYEDIYWENASSFEEAAPLLVNGDLENIDFVMEAPINPGDNSISGNISLDGEEPGFPCMVIVIASDEDDDWSEAVVSESSGYYYIDEIPAGDYYVVMMTSSTPPLYYPEEYDWENAEEVHIEGNITNIDFAIDEVSADGIFFMEGLITDGGREPLSGASVVFFAENGMPAGFGISNSDGVYNAYSLAPGEYDVLAGKTFYETQNQSCRIDTDGVLDFSLTSTQTSGNDQSLPVPDNALTCYPNPVNFSNLRSSIKISFTASEEGAGRISLYNVKGQLIENIYTGWFTGAQQLISWSPQQKHLSSGVYLMKIEQKGNTRQTQKLLMFK